MLPSLPLWRRSGRGGWPESQRGARRAERHAELENHAMSWTAREQVACSQEGKVVPVAQRQSALPTISPLSSGCLESTTDHATQLGSAQLNLIQLNSPWSISTQHPNSTWFISTQHLSSTWQLNLDQHNPAQRYNRTNVAQLNGIALLTQLKGTAGRTQHTPQTTNHNHKSQTTNHNPHPTTHKPHAAHFLILPHGHRPRQSRDGVESRRGGG